jgi:hypothetical protein
VTRCRLAAALALAVLAFLAVLTFGRRADAHGMRSAYVEVVERTPGRALVTVRAQVPVTGLRITADAPCTLDAIEDASGAEVLVCPGSVAGAALHVGGLGPILSEAVVMAVLADGTTASTLATRERPGCTLPLAGAAALGVARQYVGFGVTHILTGYDHLLFLVGLVLVLRRVRAVLLAETAFTLSHSITFSASALGWVRVSPAAVEACIALSLVLVALEAARTGSADDAPRGLVAKGAGLAFVFGLVHGLGFAGGLAEIGLPPRAIPAALAGFAGGVEIGQIAFLTLVLGLFALARRVSSARALPVLVNVATNAVGAIGFFWLIERLHALLFPLT